MDLPFLFMSLPKSSWAHYSCYASTWKIIWGLELKATWVRSSYSKSPFVISVSKETVSSIIEKNNAALDKALLPVADQTQQSSLWELWEVLHFSTKAAGGVSPFS